VRISFPQRTHLMDDNRHAEACGLPSGFGTGHSAADDVDGLNCHGADIG
jgi:hypothetical protein